MKDFWTKNYADMKAMGMESLSGTGSSIHSAKAIINNLPSLLWSFQIKTILDIPCGDHNWFSIIDLESVGVTRYIGADIVEENVIFNTAKYATKGGIKSFMVADITTDHLPKVDLVFCRDCLVHFSDEDIHKALVNIVASDSKYLMTTTFIDRRTNHDIATGGWRTLNLGITPFCFPFPITILNEECQEQDGIFADKSLALWSIDGIREAIGA